MLAALLGASSANAATTETLAECVKSSTVCLHGDSKISDQKAVEKALDGKAKVAVVSQTDVANVSIGLLAGQIAKESGTSELIMVSGSEFGVSSESGMGNTLLTALKATGKTGGEAIVAADVKTILKDAPSINPSVGGVMLAAIAAIVVTVVLFLLAVISRWRKRKANKWGKDSTETPKFSFEAKSLAVSDELKDELSTLQKLAKIYGSNTVSNVGSNFIRANIEIENLLKNLSELFGRLNRKSNRQSQRLAEQSYLSTVKKLNGALSEDYFGDLIKNPNLWENSGEKAKKVLDALESVNRQVIENIRQVNASKELEFQIALDTILLNDVPAPKNFTDD